ncbi:tRNA pseudouridine synthase A [Desulfovibrionales bacterium]
MSNGQTKETIVCREPNGVVPSWPPKLSVLNPAEGFVRLRLVLAYLGNRFHGWQTQAHKTADQPITVQSCLEAAFSHICSRPIRVHGASRTDAGVHALGQVAHADVPAAKAGIDWCAAINDHVPKALCVLTVTLAPAGFHARFSARAKTYLYSLWLSRQYVIPQRRPYVWAVGELDLVAMEAAAAMLQGKHNFACFMNLGTPVKSTVRTLYEVAWVRPVAFDLQAGAAGELSIAGPELVWQLTGDGFLKQMARNIMGCLVAVGRGRFQAEAVPELLAGRDRNKAPATAPAWGLTLYRVYDQSLPLHTFLTNFHR